MPGSESGKLELAYAPRLYKNPETIPGPTGVDGGRAGQLEAVEKPGIGVIQYLRKTVQFLYRHGPRFASRKALWRIEYTRFRRRCDSWHARAGAKPVTVRFLDQEFELHPSGKGLSEEIVLLGAHEPVCTKVYLQHLRKGDHVLDVGSNLGYYLLLAARAVGPTGQVLGFEPASDVYAILERNVARSGLSNIRVFPWAIGARSEAIDFYGSEIPNWGSLIADKNLLQARPTTVPAKKLDDLLDEFPGFHPTVLRMDLEGGELMVLEGARRLLRECQPRIFVEFHPFAFEWEQAHRAILELCDMGYSSGVVIERLWDESWASSWMRERRYWSGTTNDLLAKIESRADALNTGVFSILLEPKRTTKLLCVGRSLGKTGTKLSGGGVLRVQTTLLDHLLRSGFKANLFYLNRVEHESPAPCGLVPEFGAPAERWLDLHMPRVIRRLCALAKDSDVVFGLQDGRPTDLAILVGRITRRPVVGWIHNLPGRTEQDFPGGHPWITRFLYPRATRLVAVSEGIAEDLAKWLPGSAYNVVTLPNPVDVAGVRRLGELPLPDWARAIFARRTLVGMGWLNRRKGFDLLLESFATVVRMGHDINLLLLGEGEERPALEAQADDLGLHGRVFMPGYQSDPYPLLSRAEAFVLSSRHEGLPTVILEAMSLGVPVVASDCPFGPAEILDGGRCGLLVPSEDPQAMADAISNLLSSGDLRTRFRGVGFERAMQYDTSVVTKKFENLFLELLEECGQQKQ